MTTCIFKDYLTVNHLLTKELTRVPNVGELVSHPSFENRFNLLFKVEQIHTDLDSGSVILYVASYPIVASEPGKVNLEQGQTRLRITTSTE